MDSALRLPSGHRVDAGFAAALGALPYLGYERAQPMPGFWGEWVAVALSLMWLAVAGLPRRGWAAGAPFLAVGALMLVHLAARLVPMPLSVLVATGLLAIAAALAARATTGAAPEIARGFAAGLLVGFAANAIAVAFERAGYEWQLVSLVAIETPPRAVGLLGQSNHVATLAVLAIGAAVFLRQTAGLGRWAVWGVTIAAAFVVAATSSRAGIVVGLAVFILIAACAKGRSNVASGPELGRLEIFALAAAFLAAQWLWIVWPGSSAAGAPAASTLISRSDAGRTGLWLDALQLWRAHPLIGVGHGNYAQARLHDLAGPFAQPHVDHAHNLFLQVASEWGLAGFVVVGVASVWLALAAWQALREPVSRERQFGLVVILALGVHSLAEHPLWFSHYLFAMALAVGLTVGRSAPGPTGNHRPMVAVVFGMLVAVGLAGVAAIDYLRLQRVAAGLRADVIRDPGAPPRVTLAEVVAIERLTLFPRPATMLLAAVLPINPVAVEAKLAVARRAMDMAPAGSTIARWAALSAIAGRGDEARALLTAMRARNLAVYAEAHAILTRASAGAADLEAFVASLPPA